MFIYVCFLLYLHRDWFCGFYLRKGFRIHFFAHSLMTCDLENGSNLVWICGAQCWFFKMLNIYILKNQHCAPHIHSRFDPFSRSHVMKECVKQCVNVIFSPFCIYRKSFEVYICLCQSLIILKCLCGWQVIKILLETSLIVFDSFSLLCV